jgi:hypothetical protein
MLTRLRRTANDAWNLLKPASGQQSFSQQGEDLVLRSLLEEERIAMPNYVDIGSNDPVRLSNTYLFYSGGSQGLCVEPNPAYNLRYRRFRGRDRLLNVGVTAGSSGSLDYFEMDWPEFNTFDAAQAKEIERRYEGRNSIRRVSRKPILNINELLEQRANQTIDLLSLDVEGSDLGILGALDFSRFGPRFICVEHTGTVTRGSEALSDSIQQLLASKGYLMRAHNSINAIYQRAG